jgi:hypothetical protein
MRELLMAVLIHGRAMLVQRRHERGGERGDVPGWVLVTVMTAGLVMAIWGLARDELSQILETALKSVKG